MFPAMEVEGESFVLRPMNCPHHMMIYANKMHSYKDLPILIGVEDQVNNLLEFRFDLLRCYKQMGIVLTEMSASLDSF